MKPYYEHEGQTIYHGDAREIMPTLPKFDLVLTDPPYVNLDGGYVRDYQGGVGKKTSVTTCVTDPWNASLDWMPLAWEITKFGMMIFCSSKSVCETREALSDAKIIALLTWSKRNAPPTGKNVPRHTSEFIWALSKNPGLKWDAFTETVFDIPNINAGCMATERFIGSDEKALHPTQKPIALMKKLLQVSPSNVLDPFCGSGTTLEAAKQMGIRAVGIELEEKYCEIAAKRLAQEVLEFA